MKILITGITGDIGNDLCSRLLKSRHTVIGVFNKNIEKARSIKNQSKELGNLTLYQGNLNDKEFIHYLFEQIGEIDVVINNAGINSDNLFTNMEYTEWNEVIETNLISNIRISNEILNMTEKKHNKCLIINIVSVSAVYGREGQTNYSFSKGGVIGLSKLLSTRENLRTINIAPGMMDSKMVDEVPQESLETFLKYTSLKKKGKVSDISDLIDKILLMESEYLTNTTLKLDGGFMR